MENQNPVPKDLPKVLLLLPQHITLTLIENQLSEKFQLIKEWEFPIPADQFLATHASSVEAMLISGYNPITADFLRRLPMLRLVLTTSTGLNHIDLPECRRRGISVANAGSTYSENVADMAVGLLIDVMRKITAADRYVRAGVWPIKLDYPLASKFSVANMGSTYSENVADMAVGLLIDVMRKISAADRYVRAGVWRIKLDYPLASKLEGKRVGIIGLGNIGLEVAKRLEAFGCSISYNSRKKKPSVPFPFYENVCDLATNCDIIVLCCGLTDQTRHVVNKEVLLALGKEGVVINIARGAVVDEKALVWCLVERQIAGAGLDVFENEPDVPKELLALDNVVMSPHRAIFTEESFRELGELMSGNLEAFFSNKPLLSLIVDE